MGLPVELINVWNSPDAASGAWSWLAPVLVGPFIGSFLGVLIVRLPEGRPVVVGRSACSSCGHVLGPAELVPVVGYLVLRGRCRSCGRPIGRFHLAVELAALAVAAWAACLSNGDLLWASCALGWALLAAGWTDARSQRLPDMLTLPLLLAGLAEACALEPDALLDRALGALAGYVIFRALAFAYRRLRAREGLGQGDAKLLAAGGAWVGLAALGDVILAAAIAALGWAVLLRLRGRQVDASTRIPFGPFLAFGIWLGWLYAP